MGKWNPWTHANDQHPNVDVYTTPCSVPGLYFPDEHAIIIAEGQSRIMRRSVLAEELAHLELGHRPHSNRIETERMELRARRWAALRLITLDELADAIVGTASWFEVAEYLDVDESLLRQRLGDLTVSERGTLWKKIGRKELGL
jgi:Zn-dependent peptidase ImmA (M78 family)